MDFQSASKVFEWIIGLEIWLTLYEWLKSTISIQKHALLAFYDWAKGLYEVLTALWKASASMPVRRTGYMPVGRVGPSKVPFYAYLAQTPIFLGEFMIKHNIDINVLVSVYVLTLFMLMNTGMLLLATVKILRVAYSIVNPISPDNFGLRIIKDALLYLLRILEFATLIWNQTGGYAFQMLMLLQFIISIPVILIVLMAWNFRPYVCDVIEDPNQQGESIPNIPKVDSIPFINKLLCNMIGFKCIPDPYDGFKKKRHFVGCYAPYWSVAYPILTEWWEWLNEAAYTVAMGLLTAFQAMVNLIKNIIGGLGGICDHTIGPFKILDRQDIEIPAGSLWKGELNLVYEKKKFQIPKHKLKIPGVFIPKVEIPGIPLAPLVGGKTGAFCKAMDNGKQDMIDNYNVLENGKCKVKAWKNGTKCGAHLCNVKYNVKGAQDGLDKCEDPAGYAVKVEARRVAKEKADAKAAEAKRIADAKAAAKKKADAKAAAKRARMMSVGRGTPYWHIYNTNNKIYMSLQPSTHNPIVRKMYRGNGTGNGAGVNDTRVVIRDEDGNALGVGKLKVNTPYYIQSVNSSGAWLGCDQPTGSSKVLKTVKIDDARKFEFTGGKNNRIKLSGYAGYNMHAGSTQLGNKWYAKKSITGTTTFNLWWATNGGFQEIQMTKEEEAAAARELVAETLAAKKAAIAKKTADAKKAKDKAACYKKAGRNFMKVAVCRGQYGRE